MPWHIIQKDGNFCVVKKDGEVKKCYAKRREALAYLRALYANVPEASDGKEKREK